DRDDLVTAQRTVVALERAATTGVEVRVRHVHLVPRTRAGRDDDRTVRQRLLRRERGLVRWARRVRRDRRAGRRVVLLRQVAVTVEDGCGLLLRLPLYMHSVE